MSSDFVGRRFPLDRECRRNQSWKGMSNEEDTPPEPRGRGHQTIDPVGRAQVRTQRGVLQEDKEFACEELEGQNSPSLGQDLRRIPSLKSTLSTDGMYRMARERPS